MPWTLTRLLVAVFVVIHIEASPGIGPIINKRENQIKDDKVLKSIESNLMSLFGFSKRPKPKRENIIIPQELLNLYKVQTGMALDTTNLLLPGRQTRSANTVRSFTHKESPIDAQFQKNHRFRLSFPVDSVPKSEKLQAAELQLSRTALEICEGVNHSLQILVHDIVLPGIRGKREPIVRLIDTRRVFAHISETVKLDVTPAVQRWHEDPKNNHGLLVVVEIINNNNITIPNNITKHVRLKRDVSRDEWRKVEPILFTYTDDGKSKKRSLSTDGLVNRSRRGARKSRRKELCRRHELYVDFVDVGWNDWIVAPPGYDAFYCSGECPFPLSDHFNSTNHAIVQTLVNSVFPNTAPKACCVPTTLAPISMLYVDEENKVVLKNYQDMSILGCGCR